MSPRRKLPGRHPRPRGGVHLHLARPHRPAVLPQGGGHPGRGGGVQAPHRRPARARGYRPTSTTTFATYAADWIDTWPLKDQTRARYRGILRRELLPVFGPLPLAKIHPHHVRSWVAGQVAGPLSASSVRQSIAVLRSCLKAAQIDGHLETLPLLGVKMPRSHSRQPTVLTLEEAFAMIAVAPAAWRCAIATALFTGLRLGELLALTREDVDLPGRRLNIRATLTEVSGRTPRIRREEPKSRAGYRQVPVRTSEDHEHTRGRKGLLTCSNADRADQGRVTTASVTAGLAVSQSLAAVKSKNRGGSGSLSAVRMLFCPAVRAERCAT